MLPAPKRKALVAFWILIKGVKQGKNWKWLIKLIKVRFHNFLQLFLQDLQAFKEMMSMRPQRLAEILNAI